MPSPKEEELSLAGHVAVIISLLEAGEVDCAIVALLVLSVNLKSGEVPLISVQLDATGAPVYSLA